MTHDVDGALPFAVHVAANPKIKIAHQQGEEGILMGTDAVIAAGAQPEFVSANLLQAQAMKCSIILRAGDPPQYNKERSPKSGLNLTKTSKQGFFKGVISEEERFSRLLDAAHPLPHDEDDAEHLLLNPADPDYQHTQQLDINMHDILREVGTKGDLTILGFDETNGLARFAYKEGRGPNNDLFGGQFVVNLYQGSNRPMFYSRAWDRPENNPHWDPVNQIIEKPQELNCIPDSVYQGVFHRTFTLNYTETKDPNPKPDELKPARVFANRPRDAEVFKAAMGEDHAYFPLIKHCDTLNEILSTLNEAIPQEVDVFVKQIYDKTGRIVAGDWDGLALGHPPHLDSSFTEVINVFAPGVENKKNRIELLSRSNDYLNQIKAEAREKEQPSAFEKKVLSINRITDIANDFALARAGRITAHEFVFQHVLNDVYRDSNNEHYGETYDKQTVQHAMNMLLCYDDRAKSEMIPLARYCLKEAFKQKNQLCSSFMLDQLAEHMASHLPLAHNTKGAYILPHLQHDMNVHDLYQHGFDMRNPYGSNLDGPWLLINDDACILYGQKQEELIEVLLTGDFLEKNRIDINHGANMEAGWALVIQKQLELGQTIPDETLKRYHASQHTIPPVHSEHSLIEKCVSMKAQISAMKQDVMKHHASSEYALTEEAQKGSVSECFLSQK